jgi:carbonic anhydrase/acetyltransferase-like protein (isoleucine patch superfamily)
MSLKMELDGNIRRRDAREALSGMPLMIADLVKFAVEMVVYGIAFFCAGTAFTSLWRLEAAWAKPAAFPAAWLGLVLGFYAALALLRVLIVRRVAEGTCDLKGREALRWVLAQSYLLMVERSFLRGYVLELAPQRYLFYRMLGAKIDPTALFGGKATLTDPWALEIGARATIGAESFIAGHAVEGPKLTVRRVRIGEEATVGMRAVVMPGAEIGRGAIIAAGAVLAKNAVVPDGEVWGGVPAVRLRDGRSAAAAEG